MNHVLLIPLISTSSADVKARGLILRFSLQGQVLDWPKNSYTQGVLVGHDLEEGIPWSQDWLLIHSNKLRSGMIVAHLMLEYLLASQCRAESHGISVCPQLQLRAN